MAEVEAIPVRWITWDEIWEYCYQFSSPTMDGQGDLATSKGTLVLWSNGYSMKSKEFSRTEIILRVEQGQQDMYFLSDDRKYKKIHLSGTEEYGYHVLDDPISDTLSPWVQLSVLENTIEGKKSFAISSGWYGLTPEEEKAITKAIRQVHRALSTGASLSVNLNSIFNLSDWVPTLE
ncbi:MAG TPA: hypothetical protein VK249_22995 [Anaerolineales bacterium]|nr:hypothetical protein [Anaerolineales bacterium]